MSPKHPNRELELKKNKKWINEERDPWREVTDLLGKIEPLNQVPANYDFKKLHDQVMGKIDQITPSWGKGRNS